MGAYLIDANVIIEIWSLDRMPCHAHTVLIHIILLVLLVLLVLVVLVVLLTWLLPVIADAECLAGHSLIIL